MLIFFEAQLDITVVVTWFKFLDRSLNISMGESVVSRESCTNVILLVTVLIARVFCACKSQDWEMELLDQEKQCLNVFPSRSRAVGVGEIDLWKTGIGKNWCGNSSGL